MRLRPLIALCALACALLAYSTTAEHSAAIITLLGAALIVSVLTAVHHAEVVAHRQAALAGAVPHEPRHSTFCTLKRPSALTSPTLRPFGRSM